MEDNVSKIKDRLDVVDVISGYLKLQKAGMNFKARCPFHNEKTPSFVVSPERQVWHCFGCSKGGDIFTFVQDIEGVEFPEALRMLADKAGIKIESFNYGVKDDKARLYEVCETATKFFEKQFNSNTGKLAFEYLKNRGVADSTIGEFRLGFAPNDWNALGTFLKNCGFSEDEIVEAGLAIKRNDGSGIYPERGREGSQRASASYGIYDRFRSRITFPIFDLNGQVVGFTGRIFEFKDARGSTQIDTRINADNISVNQREVGVNPREPAAKYINTPQTRIYDKGRILYGLNKAKMDIKQADLCVLVEGNMDALMSYQAGVKNVVASSGTALTPSHLSLLHRYTSNLGFCFDTDQAGAMATKRGIGLALSQNFNIKVVEIKDKECKDPADLIRKYDSSPDASVLGVGHRPLLGNSVGASWSKVVGEAKPVMEFYFDKAKAGFNPDSADSKKSVILALAPFLKRLASQVEKSHWLTKLAFLLRTKEEAIEEDVNSVKDDLEAYDREPVLVKAEIKNAGMATDPLSETLLSLVMKNPIYFKNDIKNINPELLDSYTAEAIVKLTAIQSDNLADLLKDFREKNQSYKLEFAYLRSQELWKDSKEEELRTEFNNLVKKLEERHLRVKLEEIGLDMRVEGDKEKKLAMAVEANKILNRLGEIQKI